MREYEPFSGVGVGLIILTFKVVLVLPVLSMATGALASLRTKRSEARSTSTEG
jgi:hypothetical protein